MLNLDLEKAEELETKLLTSVGSSKKQENSRRTSTSASLIMLKPLTMDHNKLENSERDGGPKCLPSDLKIRSERTVFSSCCCYFFEFVGTRVELQE